MNILDDKRGIRNPNLDLLRTIAIFLVVIYHLIQMSPVPLPEMMRFVQYGKFGVDLFFVLSGWLIGTLYWNELFRFGKIDLSRFWMRRWVRTIPPYLVALLISWCAVFIARREQFDLGYLVFVQNYRPQMPFFLVSWSLSIEEHFYLLIPVFLFLIPKQKYYLFFSFLVLFLVSPICRYFESLNGLNFEFGYFLTATHLRLEGLTLGFGLAYFPIFFPKHFSTLSRFAPITAAVAGLLFIASQFFSVEWTYRVEPTVLSVGLAAILIVFVRYKGSALSSSMLVRAVAIASYSAYLTHALVIHAILSVMNHLPRAYWFVYFPVAGTCIITVAAAFYWAIELSSIRWRDSRVPRRTEGELAPKTLSLVPETIITKGVATGAAR